MRPLLYLFLVSSPPCAVRAVTYSSAMIHNKNFSESRSSMFICVEYHKEVSPTWKTLYLILSNMYSLSPRRVESSRTDDIRSTSRMSRSMYVRSYRSRIESFLVFLIKARLRKSPGKHFSVSQHQNISKCLPCSCRLKSGVTMQADAARGHRHGGIAQSGGSAQGPEEVQVPIGNGKERYRVSGIRETVCFPRLRRRGDGSMHCAVFCDEVVARCSKRELTRSPFFPRSKGKGDVPADEHVPKDKAMKGRGTKTNLKDFMHRQQKLIGFGTVAAERLR